MCEEEDMDNIQGVWLWLWIAVLFVGAIYIAGGHDPIGDLIKSDFAEYRHWMTLDHKEVISVGINSHGYLFIFTDGTRSVEITTRDPNDYTRLETGKEYKVYLNKYDEIVRVE